MIASSNLKDNRKDFLTNSRDLEGFLKERADLARILLKFNSKDPTKTLNDLLRTLKNMGKVS